MTRAASDQAAIQRHRLADRDTNAHGDVRPGTGESSNVSPDRLTVVAQGYPVASAATDARRSALAANVNAATLPEAGTARTTAGNVDRPQVGGTSRAKGKGGPAR